MKKRYRRRLIGFWGAVYLFILVFCLWLPVSASAQTDQTDLYEESLSFDSHGNLHMTTHDKKASGGVRYRTIGWVMRRTKEAEGAGQAVRLKLEEEGTSQPDPAHPGYMFTSFKCEGSLIFTKIGEAAADWQMDLYQNGGFVYLDAIMTVVENEVERGSMDADGMLHGEVYTTAAGIMNARDWADPKALLTHYNKEVFFPPIPKMVVSNSEKAQEEVIRFQYGQEECRNQNEARIRAARLNGSGELRFDVTKGIPTGEQVVAEGNLQKYYYEGILKHCFGVVPVPVEITVTYTYPVAAEQGISTGIFTSSFTYYVGKIYSYYQIEQMTLFTLKDALVENQSLPVSPMEFCNLYGPRVTLEQNRESYLEMPACRAFVFGGSLLDEDGMTADKLEAIAEQAAEDVWVRNDALIIDGEIILDGSFVRRETQEMKKQEGARLTRFCSDAVTIPHTKRNDSYETYAVACYEEFLQGERQEKVIYDVNQVVVHTPVVCKGGVTDDIAHNQQVKPTSRCSLILGRNFEVGISMFGDHKDQPGYGTGDYEAYTKLLQVRFPFEVYDGETLIKSGSWIDLPKEQKYFYLPVSVHEGDYSILFRTIAKNADAEKDGIDRNEYLANHSMDNYGAYDEMTVTVVGRMYDLAITDIVDYPRWRSVFYDESGKKRPFAYWIGEKNLEGQMLSTRSDAGRIPILQGSHPYNPNAGVPGLGYRVKLQLKTVGDMRDENCSVVFFPVYYHISRDGRERREVRLYRKNDLTEAKRVLILGAQNRSFVSVRRRNVSDTALQATAVQVWDGEYQLAPDLYLVDAGINLDTYIRLHGGRINEKDSVFLKDGYLLVQFEIRSHRGENAHLSYANRENSSRGYCNMWRLQGFSYERRDCAGNVFTFSDGDCLLFDTMRSLHGDYESWGTH